MKREDFLSNIRTKIGQAYLPSAEATHPGSFNGYSWSPHTPQDELVAQFQQELEALKGHVYLLDDVEETAETILNILQQHNTDNIISWGDNDLGLDNLQQVLGESGVKFTGSKLPETADGRQAQLNEIDPVFVGLTGAQGALADTGAIGLLSGAERGRLASLAPPVHIALLRKETIHPSLPAFLAAHEGATAESSNLVFIAGPSRTGDIEMTLSIGVHGPGEIHVIIY